MKITKFGHCCLLIQEQKLSILTDPGSYTTAQDTLTGINIILITHEHRDHFHLESVKKILEHNPDAKIITNSSVGKLLDAEKIPYTVVDDGKEVSIDGVLIEGKGKMHAEIYSTITPVENTGYLLQKRLFYPGDAFYNPKVLVDILALPVSAPWLKISEAINYAREVKPTKAFPVHDGMLNSNGSLVNTLPQKILSEAGIEFIVLELGRAYDV